LLSPDEQDVKKDRFQRLCSPLLSHPTETQRSRGRKVLYRTILGFGAALTLLPVGARADVIIEFTDGHQMIVSQYLDEGQTIRIYTPQGVVGLNKDEVRRITAVDDGQSMHMQLETLQNQTSALTQAPVPASTARQEVTRTQIRSPLPTPSSRVTGEVPRPRQIR
jgi:hypothetical protein